MKTTLNELRKLFKLEGSDFRQLKLGLVNKIKIIDENNVEIKDEELSRILTEFRLSGSYTMKEICDLYSITQGTLRILIKTKRVTYYSLKSSVGSKLLFLKSDLEKEGELTFIKTFARKHGNLTTFSLELLREMEALDIVTEREYELFHTYYFTDTTYEKLGEEYDLTRERVRQLIRRVEGKIMNMVVNSLKIKAENKKLQTDYDALIDKFKHVERQNINYQISIEKWTAKYSIENPVKYRTVEIKDLNFSVRVFKCLTDFEIKTLDELLLTDKSRLLKIRNFGKICLTEIENNLRNRGIDY